MLINSFIIIINSADSSIRVGVGKDLIINILPSDDAFGIFSFTDDSLSKVVEESGGSATFTIFRGSKGSFGDVAVYWEVEGPAGDVTPSSGYTNFTTGQVSADISITVNNDVVCKLMHSLNCLFINYLLTVNTPRTRSFMKCSRLS